MRTKLLSTAAAVSGLLLLATSANALPVSIQMTEISGVTTTGPTTVAGPTDGSVTFSGSFGDFLSNTVSGTGSFGTTLAGPQPQPQLNGSTVNISSTCDTCQLIIKISETGLTYPTPMANYTTNYDWLVEKGAVGKTVFSAYISNSDTAFGNDLAIGSPFTANKPTAVVTSGVLVNGIAPTFAETLQYSISFGDCAVGTSCSVSLQSEIDAVPEPASLSLMGAGLIAFGAWRRRRNQKA